MADREKTFRKAQGAVEARNYEAALRIFQFLAQQNPRDFEARDWVARLQSWKGNYLQAETLYRKVLADAPGNLEAELGLADVLAWQKRYWEAIERLHALRARFPSDTQVLVRLGRFSLWQHRRDEALWHYGEVLKLDPENAEARAAVRALREQKRFRLETGYYLENFDFAGNTNGQFVELLYQNYQRTTLVGRFQYQNKFRQNDTGFTLGATFRALERTWLRGEVSLAPRSNTVIPNQDYTIEVTQGLRPNLAAGGDFRFLRFRDAEVRIPGALVNWDLRPGLHLYVRYTPARTHFDALARSVWNHGGWSRLEWDASRRFSPYALFGIGAEDFTAVSSDQLGRFAAHTYGAGAKVRLSAAQGIRVEYYHQNRTQGHFEQSFGVSYSLNF